MHERSDKVSINKTIKKVAVCISIISILLTACSTAPNLNQMTEYFHSDREKLQLIVDYLISTNFNHISIRNIPARNSDSTNIEMSTGLGTGSAVISDEYVSEAVLLLFQQGYRGITKSGSFIIFQRWSTLDAGRGIAYSIDRNTPIQAPPFDFLIEVEPLTEDSWYFYVDDFNEWRRQNSD